MSQNHFYLLNRNEDYTFNYFIGRIRLFSTYVVHMACIRVLLQFKMTLYRHELLLPPLTFGRKGSYKITPVVS